LGNGYTRQIERQICSYQIKRRTYFGKPYLINSWHTAATDITRHL